MIIQVKAASISKKVQEQINKTAISTLAHLVKATPRDTGFGSTQWDLSVGSDGYITYRNRAPYSSVWETGFDPKKYNVNQVRRVRARRGFASTVKTEPTGMLTQAPRGMRIPAFEFFRAELARRQR